MFYSDIHIHILCNTDDGAKNQEAMFAMADTAYKNGIRLICATPHFSPGDFGNNSQHAEESFEILQKYCSAKYPDLSLFLGNELFCDGESVQWLKKGYCKTMNGTRYVLAEFPFTESETRIVKSVKQLLRSGYVPIIAHAERYTKLTLNQVRKFRENGVIIQINSVKNWRGICFFEKRRLKRILSHRMADIVSSDAHNITDRAPDMGDFYNWVFKKYGAPYAEQIFRTNAERILTEGLNGK